MRSTGAIESEKHSWLEERAARLKGEGNLKSGARVSRCKPRENGVVLENDVNDVMFAKR